MPQFNRPKTIDEHQLAEVQGAIGAKTLLDTLGPLIEQQFDQLLARFQFCDPSLGALLDYRARISTLFQMRARLRQAAAQGQNALEVFESMMKAAAVKEAIGGER